MEAEVQKLPRCAVEPCKRCTRRFSTLGGHQPDSKHLDARCGCCRFKVGRVYKLGQRPRAVVAGCILAFTSQTMSAAFEGAGAFHEIADSCRRGLRDLVAHLAEAALLEGHSCRAKRRDNGDVVILCSDYSQFLWCQEGELHIRYDEPIPKR